MSVRHSIILVYWWVLETEWMMAFSDQYIEKIHIFMWYFLDTSWMIYFTTRKSPKKAKYREKLKNSYLRRVIVRNSDEIESFGASDSAISEIKFSHSLETTRSFYIFILWFQSHIRKGLSADAFIGKVYNIFESTRWRVEHISHSFLSCRRLR